MVGDNIKKVQRDGGSLIAGWSAFKPPYRYTSSMRCEEPSVLVRLSGEAFEQVFDEDPYLGYLILKRVATVIDRQLEGAITFLLETSSLPEQQ